MKPVLARFEKVGTDCAKEIVKPNYSSD